MQLDTTIKRLRQHKAALNALWFGGFEREASHEQLLKESRLIWDAIRNDKLPRWARTELRGFEEALSNMDVYHVEFAYRMPDGVWYRTGDYSKYSPQEVCEAHGSGEAQGAFIYPSNKVYF